MTEQVKTGDGSWTLKSEQFGVTYHSVHGARTESEHVFIEHGLAQIPGDGPIRVFEVGFGTGLNAGLAWAWAKRTGRRVEYRAVEAFPVDVAVEVPGLTEEEAARLKAGTNWEEPEFRFEVEVARLEDVTFEEPAIDVVFFDAFAPSAQPELWRQEVFESLGEGVVDGGRLVTYCAQGEARRAMRAAGWRVEKAPGPPGKREMTVAFREVVNRFNVRAYALIVEGGRVLTVREDLPGGPATKFPGGGVEFGEGPEDAVLRELREELGEAGAGEITGHAYTTGFYVRSIFRPSDQILSLYYYVRLNRPLDVPTAPEAPVKVAGGEAGLKWRWARVGELGDLAFPIDRHVAEHVLKA